MVCDCLGVEQVEECEVLGIRDTQQAGPHELIVNPLLERSQLVPLERGSVDDGELGQVDLPGPDAVDHGGPHSLGELRDYLADEFSAHTVGEVAAAGRGHGGGEREGHRFQFPVKDGAQRLRD
jgi:hypothetical protein